MSVDAQRLLYGAILLAVVPLVYLLMRRGWRRRASRGAGAALPQPPAPGEPAPDEELAEAVYVSTAVAGRPFERVVVHGLGARSGAGVGVVGAAGHEAVVIRRDGAPSLLVAASALVGVGRSRGQVGKFVAGRGGLVVMTWRLGDMELDTALHLRDTRDAEDLVAAVAALVPPHGTTGDGAGAGAAA